MSGISFKRLWRKRGPGALLSYGVIACLCLTGCRSDSNEDWRQEQAWLAEQRVAAQRILAKAPPTTRQVVPFYDGVPDLRLVIAVDANGCTGITSVLVRYQPSAEQLEVLENGQLALAGGSSFTSHGHGESRETGEATYEMFRVSIGPWFASGAVVDLRYEFVGPRSAELEVSFPVLWDVPVQTFYWPSGQVRVEIQSDWEARQEAEE